MKNLSSIQSQIQVALGEYESLKNVSSYISEIDDKLSKAYQKVKLMDTQLDKELKDIEALQRVGVKSLFHKTLGTKEQQLEKERQEYLEMSLKYKQFKGEIDLMEYERDLLSKKLNGIEELKIRVNRLKELRKQEILSSPNLEERKQFQEILHKMDVNISLEKEISEAIEQGNKSNQALINLIAFLKQAGEWGRWDMYGDNRRAGYLKKQALDKAVRYLPQVQYQLNLFQRELRDLGEQNVSLRLDTIQMDRFKDFFFDNLISDWIIQQRIKSTLNNIEATHAHLKRIVLSLQQEMVNVKDNLKALNNQKENLLLA